MARSIETTHWVLVDRRGKPVPGIEIATTDPVRWSKARHRKVLENIPHHAYPLSWEMVRSSKEAV